MTTINFINNLLSPSGFGTLLQILVTVVMVVYVFFAFIMTRQIKLMTNSFSTQASPIFTLLAQMHFIAAIVLVAISIILL